MFLASYKLGFASRLLHSAQDSYYCSFTVSGDVIKDYYYHYLHLPAKPHINNQLQTDCDASRP